MTFDLISGLHMQIQTWHPPLWLCTHAKYYVKSGLTNVLKNANKTKNMHLFSIRIANYYSFIQVHSEKIITLQVNICTDAAINNDHGMYNPGGSVGKEATEIICT